MTHHCPRCQKTVSASAIACPHCQNPLKALGHQGIPLHQASGDSVLCETCTYHQDDSCNYPQRPLAKDCILYVDSRMSQVPNRSSPQPQFRPSSAWPRLIQWIHQNLAVVMVVGLLVISVLIVLMGQ